MTGLLLFVAIAYGLSITLGLVVGLTGGHESPLVGLGYTAMFFPAIAVMVVRLVLNDGPRIDWRRFPLKWLPAALFLIPGVLHLVMLPLMAGLEGRLPWYGWLTAGPDGLYHTPTTRGWGTLTIQGLVGRVVLNAVVGLAAVSVLAFFEEVGWRAWLLPRLRDRMSARGAVLVTALISAYWHTPYALSGIHHFDGLSATSAALFMPIGHIAAALIIGWLWLRTESVWMVAIAHGALNNWGQYAFKYMDDPIVADATRVLGLGMGALLAVGGLLLWRAVPSGE